MLKKVEKNKIKKRFTELSNEERNEIIKKAIIASNRDQLKIMNSK